MEISTGLLLGLVFGTVVLLLITGLPVAFALASVGVLFTLIVMGPTDWMAAALIVWKSMNNWVLAACLLFFIMANLLQKSGIIEDLFEAAYKWLDFIPGGLAVATVVVCAVIAAMSGVAAAGVVLAGLLALPEMRKRGYSKDISVGCVAAGGPLGVLIPPSVYFIFWGAFTGTSIGKLFFGGVFPGLLLTALFCAYIVIRCFFNPSLAPSIPVAERASWGEKLKSARAVILPLLLILAVLGTIYLGVCTPTEAAGVGAVGAFIITAVRRRLTWKAIRESLVSSMGLNAMVMWLFFGGSIFSQFLTSSGIVSQVVSQLTEIGLGTIGMLIIMQVVFIILGMFLDGICIVLVTMPFFFPVAVGLGIDPIWYGVLYIMNTQIGYLTPPFGFSLFYLKSVVPKDISFADIIHSIIPFVGLQVLGLAIVIAFPPIATWLPSMMIAK